jgi:antibiotic biosynthesis monooxygenase (ABM) superfamily enzyme
VQTAARAAARPHGRARRPPRYKTAAVTWLAIYPLVLGLSTLLARLEPGLPPALSILVVTLVTVLLATYVALPALSRLLRPWLVPSRDRERDRQPWR